MLGKLPKSEAWKQSDPKVLEQRLSVGIHRIPAELPHSSKLELRNEEGSQQAGRPTSPQSLTTLLTRLHLATTLRMKSLQVEFLKCGVCVDFHYEGGIYRGKWDLHRLGEVGLVPSGGRAAKPRGRSAEWSGFH
jgi:hypothetical protein